MFVQLFYLVENHGKSVENGRLGRCATDHWRLFVPVKCARHCRRRTPYLLTPSASPRRRLLYAPLLLWNPIHTHLSDACQNETRGGMVQLGGLLSLSGSTPDCGLVICTDGEGLTSRSKSNHPLTWSDLLDLRYYLIIARRVSDALNITK